MNKNFTEIYDSIQEISWYFGSQGFNGQCCDDLSLIEFMALKRVNEKNNCSIQEIGNSLNITKSGASKIIDRLKNREYVRRVQSSTDGRVCCVDITDQGEGIITKILERYNDYMGEILKDMSPNSVDEIRNGLAVLLASIRTQGFINKDISENNGSCC